MRSIDDEQCIILADDDADDRFLFEEATKEISDKIKIISFIDGVDLMDTLLKMTPFKPDVIFLDINMPKKNGFECLAQIRSIQSLKNIPVGIYSTCSQEDSINKAFEFGANFYIKKPDNFERLKEILQEILTINYNKVMDVLTKRTDFLKKIYH